MALTKQTKVTPSGIGEALPMGYSAPTISISFGANAVELPAKDFVIAASGVVNASASTGLTQTVSALETAVDAYLGAGAGNLGLDVSSNNVNAVYTINSVERRPKLDTESKFVTGADQLVISVRIKYEVV